MASNYTYDPIGQLQTAKGKEPGGATNRLHEQMGYGYDAAHNLNLRTNNALVQTFTVNSLNELSNVTRSGTLTVAGTSSSQATRVTVNSQSATLYGDFTFAKDGFTLTNGNNSYTAIAQDSLGRSDTNTVSVNLPTTVSCVYDLNGNLCTNGTRVFDYDDENQLIKVTEPGAWKSEFTYDGRMRMRKRKEFTWSGSWVQTNEIWYLYDGNLVIQERDANSLPVTTYTRGTDLSGSFQGAGGIGGLLARTAMPSSINSHQSTSFYHADANGNITALLNTNQIVVARYLYDSFGGILSQSGPLADANVYRFSSKEFHASSGLCYYGRRFYDANLQRWLNRDPIGDWSPVLKVNLVGNLSSQRVAHDAKQNRYGFVDNDPIANLDYLGLWTFGVRVNISIFILDFTLGLYFDGQGNYENQCSSGWGGTLGGSITAGITTTTAESVRDIRGTTYTAGIAAGLPIGAQGEGMSLE